MALRSWDPFRDLEALRREVERAFEDFGGGFRWNRPFSRTAFLPQLSARTYPLVNVGEDKDHVYVDALAPGLDPESIEVTVVNDTLRIAGEKSPIRDAVKPEAFHRSERGAGRFVRSLSLPAGIESGRVSAEYRDGLLRLTLPKHEQAKPKQIAVSVA